MSTVQAIDEILSETLMKKHQGELLTIVDAVSADRTQRDAMKSLVRQSCQKCLAELTSRLEVIQTKAEAGKAT